MAPAGSAPVRRNRASSALHPLRASGSVALPINSRPDVIAPSPFVSRASSATSDRSSGHATISRVPSPSISNGTPCVASVSWNASARGVIGNSSALGCRVSVGTSPAKEKAGGAAGGGAIVPGLLSRGPRNGTSTRISTSRRIAHRLHLLRPLEELLGPSLNARVFRQVQDKLLPFRDTLQSARVCGSGPARRRAVIREGCSRPRQEVRRQPPQRPARALGVGQLQRRIELLEDAASLRSVG